MQRITGERARVVERRNGDATPEIEYVDNFDNLHHGDVIVDTRTGGARTYKIMNGYTQENLGTHLRIPLHITQKIENAVEFYDTEYFRTAAYFAPPSTPVEIETSGSQVYKVATRNYTLESRQERRTK